MAHTDGSSMARVGFRSICLMLAASVGLAALAGCAANSSASSASDPADRPVDEADTSVTSPRQAHAEEVFPFSTLREMRTFTDSWVHVRAVRERFAPTEGEGEGEGYKPRWVTFEVIDRAWQRESAEAVLDTFESELMGYAVSDGKDHPLSSGGPLVQIDREYLLGLVDFGDVVAPAAGRAVILVEGGRVVIPTDDIGRTGQGELASLDGMPVSEAVVRIAEADPLVPDEVSDPMQRLDMWQRSQ